MRDCNVSFKANAEGQLWKYVDGKRFWLEDTFKCEADACKAAMILNEQVSYAYSQGREHQQQDTAELEHWLKEHDLDGH